MGRQINGRISSSSFNDIENLNFMSISYESNKRDVNRKLDNSSKNVITQVVRFTVQSSRLMT